LELPLREIMVEITGKCLLSCLHCSVYDPSLKGREMDLDDFKKIVDSFASLGGETLHISGGEPLSHAHLPEMIKYAKDSHLEVRLFSCGIIDDIPPRVIAEELAKSKVDKISVSLQGSNANTHDIITTKQGSFQKTVNFIKNLVKQGLYTKINFVPMKLNFEEIEDLIEYAVKLGANEVNVLRFVPQGRGVIHRDTLILTKDEFSALVEFVTQQRGRNDIRVNVGTPFDFCFLFNQSYNPKQCTAGINECVVKLSGDVIPCPAYTDLEEYIAGNVFDSSLKEIWINSKVFDRIRKFEYEKIRGLCKSCQHFDKCKGRCPAQRILEYGDIYQGPDPFCPK